MQMCFVGERAVITSYSIHYTKLYDDNQCCGQTYLDLYEIDAKPERLKDIKASVDLMLETDKIDDWDWIDALQMAMPVITSYSIHYTKLYQFTSGNGR